MSSNLRPWISIYEFNVFNSGASIELFKNYFSIGGVNFYSVFKKNQMERELRQFEDELRQRNERILAHHSAALSPPIS